MKFTAKKDRLYYSDLSTTEGVYMFSNMEGNQKHYTQQHYERENTSRELSQMVGHPSTDNYKKFIKINAIKSVQSQGKTLIYVRISLVLIFTH